MRKTCLQLSVSVVILMITYSCFTFFYPHFFDENEVMKKVKSDIAHDRELPDVHH